MNRKIIIIGGYLAAGKSEFARRVSQAIGIPYLIKDTLKTALCASVPITNSADSSRFSAVTFDAVMYVAERLLEVGFPIIIEGNFVPVGVKKTDDAGVIKTLIGKLDCRSLTFKFMGDTRVLYERYIERDKTPERGDANRDFTEVTFADFDRYCHRLDDFSVGGQTVLVDTTSFDAVDFARHIDTARHFIKHRV